MPMLTSSSASFETKVPAEFAIKADCIPTFPFRWLIALTLIAFPGVAGLSILVNNHFDSRESNFIDNLYTIKENAAVLRSSPGQKRLFYISGSSGLFNFDARLAEQKLGIPVINFATHAGLTLDYILTRSKRSLRLGDAVLLA